MPRGGTRPGAGRKTKNEGEIRVTIGCMVRPSTKEAIRRMADESGISIGEAIDRLVSREK